jgi:hypothetical protein
MMIRRNTKSWQLKRTQDHDNQEKHQDHDDKEEHQDHGD